MDDLLTQIGVGGLFSLMILREVFGFLKQRNGNGGAKRKRSVTDLIKEKEKSTDDINRKLDELELTLKAIMRTVDALKDLHDARTADGRTISYVIKEHVDKVLKLLEIQRGEITGSFSKLKTGDIEE